MNFIGRILNGGLDEERYENDLYDDHYDDEYEDEYYDNQDDGKSQIININGSEKSTVVVIEPKTMDDACAIISTLKENKICVGKFDLNNSSEMQNIIDFIAGAVFALNADMDKVSDEIFIVAPSNVEIKKKVREDSRSSMNSGLFSFGKK